MAAAQRGKAPASLLYRLDGLGLSWGTTKYHVMPDNVQADLYARRSLTILLLPRSATWSSTSPTFVILAPEMSGLGGAQTLLRSLVRRNSHLSSQAGSYLAFTLAVTSRRQEACWRHDRKARRQVEACPVTSGLPCQATKSTSWQGAGNTQYAPHLTRHPERLHVLQG